MTFTRTGLIALGAVAVVTAADAQDTALDRRVAATANGVVTFHFASHASVCGDGARWLRVGDESWYGTWSGAIDGDARERCAHGPVRVAITKLDGEIIRIETAAGPLTALADANDLGAVAARTASTWFLGLAARLDGRPARDAILPAVIADSAAPTAGLLRLVQDRDRSRETRRSAIGWLARAPGASMPEATRALQALAADERDAPPIRQGALSALGRLPGGAGLAPLVTLAGAPDDQWLAREAVRVIARSGDPRAREYLRKAVADRRTPEPLRTAAITGLGGDQATGADARLLREAWPSLDGPREKEALLVAVSSVGGGANADWLLGVARDARQPVATRRRAVTLAERAGASGGQLASLFDAATETEIRLTVVAALAQEGSKPARDKLIAIANSTEIASVRRRAVTALERFGGDEVREALTSLAVP